MIPNTLNEPLSPLYEEQQSKKSVKETQKNVPRVAPPVLMHGVPTFSPAFFQIRIKQVSANPLGSHALLISAEALLFSYGLNTHGQLGHGHKSSETSGSKGFVTTPTIVTPLLENGGKAVVCAAGVDYSLVVVQTEERRVGRLQNRRSFTRHHQRHSSDSVMARASSLPSRIREEEEGDESSDDAVESMCHHQLYGFGSNDGMKLGLVSPGGAGKSGADVLLPRRVALHCKVWPETEESDKNLPPSGIFAVSASARHSAALVRRATGVIELYTWGDATFGALDSIRGDTPKRQNNQVNGRFTSLPLAVTAPTLVKGLSPSHKTNGRSTIPVQVALGPRSTFVITTSGQCLSFGKSECGLLGQGDGITSMVQPGRIVFPSAGNGIEPKIKSISVGARHAVAVASDGRVFAWGKNEGAIMGFDSALRKHLSLRARNANPSRERLSSLDDEIEWIPREIELPIVNRPTSSKTKKFTRKLSEGRLEGAPPRADDREKGCVVQAFAGNDLTVFVTESGSVLSCGASSGRLGLGETSSTSPSVVTPTPMFGGLHLWR
jgi:alpha-tubulin suppressor-like RCC1 family protein